MSLASRFHEWFHVIVSMIFVTCAQLHTTHCLCLVLLTLLEQHLAQFRPSPMVVESIHPIYGKGAWRRDTSSCHCIAGHFRQR